jgi:proline iminopeptidase
MQHASVHGTKLAYKIVGNGDPCLVMHGGLGFDHTMLHPGLDRLGDACQLVYYDHRGHGQSGRPPISTLTWEQFAHDAEGLRRYLGFKRISLIAHSLGGFPAIEYALKYPEVVHRLIVIAAVPAFDHVTQVVANMKMRGASDELVAWFDFSRAENDDVFREMMHRLAPLYFYQPTDYVIGQAFGRMQYCAEACRLTPSLIDGYALEDRLSEVKVPTLIVAGRHDFIAPVSQVKRLQNGIASSRMVVFEASGHFPFLEEPGRFLTVVRDWIETHP